MASHLTKCKNSLQDFFFFFSSGTLLGRNIEAVPLGTLIEYPQFIKKINHLFVWFCYISHICVMVDRTLL